MHTDPIADYLTRIRNAYAARKRTVEIPASNVKLGISQVLQDMGYIHGYKKTDDSKQGVIKVALKYDTVTKQPAITKIQRVSTPGLRVYSKAKEMPRVMNGLGIAVVTTSKGIMTGKQAKAQNLGGEVLCFVY